MYRFISVFLILLFGISIFAVSVDGYDKYLHYSFSLSIYSIGNYFFGNKAGLAIAGLAGIAKEIYDYVSMKGNADVYDLVADFYGISAGYNLSQKYPPMIYIYIYF